MTYAILRIVGSITIDLLEPPYALQEDGWDPKITTRAVGILGGRGLYRNVPEEIAIDIFSDTAPETLLALADVSQVLDEADAWAGGEDVDPVIFECQLEGSALSDPLQAIISNEENEGYIQTPKSMQSMLLDARIDGVTLTLTRRGQLLGTEETVASTADVTNPAAITLSNLSDLKVPSPTIVKLTDFVASADLLGDGFLLLTGVNPLSTYGVNFAVLDEPDMTYGSEWVKTADTANDSVGGNVVKIDAASNTTGTITFSDVAAEIKKLTFFLALRNNHATTTWQVRVRSGGLIDVTGRWFTIDASSQYPRILNLRSLQNEARLHQDIYIDVKTAGSVGTLDVNYLAILPHDKSTHYITIAGRSYTSSSYAHNVTVDHRALTAKAPLAYIETSE